MLDTILVPLDGSPLAERALPYAARLAKASGGKLALLRALDGPHAAGRLETEPDPYLQLQAAAGRLRAEGIEVETCLPELSGENPAEAIVRAAREGGAGLIAMSTHGRGGLGRWIYGSVADAVLHRAEVPVLLVPAACEHAWPAERPLRILVPLDGSDLAVEAIGPAAELADRLGAELLLLSVVQPPTYAYPEGYAYLALDPAEELAGAARELEAIAERLRSGTRTVKTRTALGFVVEMILQVGREEGIDLIVMATHGRGGLARFVLGSVATGALRRAGLPILLVRPAAVPRPTQQPAETPDLVTPEPAPTVVTLSLTADELDWLRRGLGELAHDPEAGWYQANAARSLLEKLRRVGAQPRHEDTRTVTLI